MTAFRGAVEEAFEEKYRVRFIYYDKKFLSQLRWLSICSRVNVKLVCIYEAELSSALKRKKLLHRNYYFSPVRLWAIEGETTILTGHLNQKTMEEAKFSLTTGWKLLHCCTKLCVCKSRRRIGFLKVYWCTSRHTQRCNEGSIDIEELIHAIEGKPIIGYTYIANSLNGLSWILTYPRLQEVNFPSCARIWNWKIIGTPR